MKYALQLHWFGNWHNVVKFETIQLAYRHVKKHPGNYRLIDLETKEEISVYSIINDFDWMKEGF